MNFVEATKISMLFANEKLFSPPAQEQLSTKTFLVFKSTEDCEEKPQDSPN